MDFTSYIIDASSFMSEAIEKMNSNKHKGLVIVENNVVMGVFTRQDLVNSLHFFGLNSTQMKSVARTDFFSISESEDIKECTNSRYTLIPILDQERHLVDIFFPNNRKPSKNYQYPVVIMAGGLGTRLYPYTKVLPKPLVPVSGTPMVERIIDKFRVYGCKDFFLIVNYKKEMIKAYFDEINKNYNMFYGEEKHQLGTGGGLYYIRDRVSGTFFLTNCDTILLEDYDEIYEFHNKNKNLITMIVASKIMQVPYGVVEVNKGGGIIKMDEKPSYGMLVNTGMYVVNKEALDSLKKEEKIGFPEHIERLKSGGAKIGVYPITEDKWIDMGQVEEYKRACDVIKEINEG